MNNINSKITKEILTDPLREGVIAGKRSEGMRGILSNPYLLTSKNYSEWCLGWCKGYSNHYRDSHQKKNF